MNQHVFFNSWSLSKLYNRFKKGKWRELIISDSHSRDDNGKAVIIKVSSIDMLVSYVEDMSKSLSTSDMLFEATAVTITLVDTQTTESSREEIFSTADIPTNANHTQATREEISPAAEISDNSGHTQHTGKEISFTEETSSNERYTQQSTVQEQQMKASTSMDIERTIRIEDSQHKWRCRQIHQWTLKEQSE